MELRVRKPDRWATVELADDVVTVFWKGELDQESLRGFESRPVK